MTIDRISYQKVFPIAQYVTERIGLEASLDEGEDPKEKLLELKEMVAQIHLRNNPGLYIQFNGLSATEYGGSPDVLTGSPLPTTPTTTSNVTPSIDRKAIERLEILIDECVTVEELIKHKPQAALLGVLSHYETKLSTIKKQ